MLILIANKSDELSITDFRIDTVAEIFTVTMEDSKFPTSKSMYFENPKTPHVEPLRRRAPEQKEFINEITSQLMDAGVVEEASLQAEWCSEPVLARSKDSHGKWRFAIDSHKRSIGIHVWKN